MPQTVDLRSDTVTTPTPEMRKAMYCAELGDDVLGDDPTVKSLEQRVARMFGKEAACFVPSGTMANQACIRALTEPGDEIIAHEQSHVYLYEGGAWAALSGCSIKLLDGDRGLFTGNDVRAALRPVDDHFPRSSLVCVENTHNRGGGSVWPVAALRDVTETASSLGLRAHLDGARVWNAHAATGVALSDLADGFDTVSVCFSKGLGAPVGSAALGAAATIARVRRVRKMLGGGMRQSGLLAAAALHALDHHIGRLADDHDRAHRLASGLAELPGLDVSPEKTETNMVLIGIEPGFFAGGTDELLRSLEERGVRLFAVGPCTLRAVTSLAVDDEGIDRAIAGFRECVECLAT